MDYNFEMTPYSRTPVVKTISVTRTGTIGLPRHFVEGHGIAQGVRAYLYWNGHTKAVAIGFTASDDEAAYPLGFSKTSHASVKARKFFKVNGLHPEEYAHPYAYKRYKPADIGISDAVADVFVIELKRHHPEG